MQHINKTFHKDRVKKKSTFNQQVIINKLDEQSSLSDIFFKGLYLAYEIVTFCCRN